MTAGEILGSGGHHCLATLLLELIIERVARDQEDNGGWDSRMRISDLQVAIQGLSSRHPLKRERMRCGSVSKLVKQFAKELRPVLAIEGSNLLLSRPPSDKVAMCDISSKSIIALNNMFNRIDAEKSNLHLRRLRFHLASERSRAPTLWSTSNHHLFGVLFKRTITLLLLAANQRPQQLGTLGDGALVEYDETRSPVWTLDAALLCLVFSFL